MSSIEFPPGLRERPTDRTEIPREPDRPAVLHPLAILNKLNKGETLEPHELALLTATFLEQQSQRRQERPYYTEFAVEESAVSGVTDGTTGNLVLPLYELREGWEGRIVSATIDVPGSSSITPAAPFANAASWIFLAYIPKGQKGDAQPAGASNANATAPATRLRQGMVAFAPVSAAGPILPGQWTFNEDQIPVMRNEAILVFVLVGGSIAALQAITIQVAYRVNLGRRGVS